MSRIMDKSETAKPKTEYGTLERGIEWYKTPGKQRRYRVRWQEPLTQTHRSKTFSKVADARSFHSDARLKRERGERIGRSDTRQIRLSEFVLNTWEFISKNSKSDKTWKRDTYIYNHYICRQLGPLPIDEIWTDEILNWQEELMKDGVQNPTIIKARSILTSIFDKAILLSKTTGIKESPMPLIDKMKYERKIEIIIWHPLVIERIIWVLEHHSTRPTKSMALQDAVYISILASSGVRPAEGTALKWSSITYDDKLSIEQAVVGDGLGPTKTGVNRKTPIIAPLDVDLARLRADRGEDRGKYVIENANGDHWSEDVYKNFRRRHFRPALRYVADTWEEFSKALREDGVEHVPESVEGIEKTRLYDMRHFASALMLSSAKPIIDISYEHGHSVRVLSDRYSQQMHGLGAQMDPAERMTIARKHVEKASNKIKE